MQNATNRNTETLQKIKPNILFFSEYEISPNFGGIERVTTGIASALIEDGYQVYNAYVNTIPERYNRANFSGCIQVDLFDIASFVNYLNNNNIDIILLQNTFKCLNFILSAIKQCNRPIKTVFTHHMLPESEYSFLRFHKYKRTLFNNLKNYFRDIMRLTKWFVNYPLVKLRWKQTYRQVYDKCDSVVLLSKEYIENWKDFAKLDSLSKFRIIPNPRTFDSSFLMEDYDDCKRAALEARGGS